MSDSRLEVAGDILLSQRIERPQVAPYERRVRADGWLEEWSSVRVEIVNDETHFLEQEPEWRPVVRLSKSEIDELAKVIATAGFPELAGEHLPAGTAIGGSIVTWAASLDGERHAVILNGAPAVKLPALDRLAVEFEQIVARALDRARKAGDQPD